MIKHRKHRTHVRGKTMKDKAINEWLRVNKSRLMHENNLAFREAKMKCRLTKKKNTI